MDYFYHSKKLQSKNGFKKSISNIFLILFFVVFFSVYAKTASATLYQPGETLEPACAPTDSNCGVAVFNLNGLSTTTQAMIVGTSGTDFNISTTSNSHIFNIPTASSLNRGLLSALDWTTFNNKLSDVLNTDKIFIGDGSNQASAVSLSGDATLSSGGVLTLSNDSVITSDITNKNITYAKFQDIGASKLLGNSTGSSGVVGEIGMGNGLTFSGTEIAINSPVCASGERLAWDGTAFICKAGAAFTVTNANYFLAGPTSGSSATSSYRAITAGDLGAGATTSKEVLLGNQSWFTLFDGAGKIDSSVLPSSITGSLKYQGTWNANTNTPTLASGGVGGVNGDFYIVSATGTTLIDGNSTWNIGDWIINASTTWNRIQQGATVSSVNGQNGAVVLTTDTINEGLVNKYFTDTRARNAFIGNGPITVSTTTGNIDCPTCLLTTAGNGSLISGTGLSLSGTLSNRLIGSSSITFALSNTAVTAGSYGGNTFVPTFTVDGQGRLTSAGTTTLDTSAISSGNLSVARGGTGAESFTTNGVLYGSSTNSLMATAAGTSGQFLVANSSGVPTFVSASGDVGISSTGVVTIGTGAVTSAKIADGTITNTDISGSASIAYSKLNLVGQILNADIATGTIANNRLANSSVSLSLTNSGSDITLSSSSVALGDTLVITVPNASATARGVVSTTTQTFAGNKTFNDSISVVGTSTLAGDFVTTRGTGYSTTGTQNNVDFGVGSYFHYEGNGIATFTGIAGGVDGRLIRLLNDSDYNLTLKNLDSGSSPENRIETPNGEDIILTPDLMVALIYDSQSSNWHLASMPATANTVKNFSYINGGNGFGSTAVLGTTDAYGLSFITGGNNRFTIAKNGASSATLTGNGATTIAGGTTLALTSASSSNLSIISGTTGNLILDSGTTGSIAIGTSTNAKNITVGNTTGNTSVNIISGSGGINLTGLVTLTNASTTNITTSGSISVGGMSTTTNGIVNTQTKYQVAGLDVITSNTLGSGIVNSSLTSLGILNALNVSGTSTLATTSISSLSLNNNLTSSFLAVDSNGNVIGTTTSQFLTTTTASSTYLSIANASSTYYLASNPSSYITASALTPYLSTTSAALTYLSIANASSTYYLASNPSSYITASALTPYLSTASAAANYVSTSTFNSNIGNYLTIASANSTYEILANKSTDGTLASSSDILYPSQKAVKTYVDNAVTGLVWQQSVEIINVIADTATPVLSPKNNDVYIINTGGATSTWSSFAVGDMIQYQTDHWVFIKNMSVGDRFGVSFVSTTTASGSMTGKDNYVATISGGTSGAFTYSFTAPFNNEALFVSNKNAFYYNVAFTYSSTLSAWVQLSATTNYNFGNGLRTSGANISLGDLTSAWNQAGAFDITTAGKIGIGTTTPATALSVIGTSTTQGLNISSLSSAFLAVDSSGNVIGTTTSQFLTTTTASSTYLSIINASSTYYLSSNPSSYITASALSPYLSTTSAALTYLSIANASSTYYLASNPSSYITASALTPYLSTTSASVNYVSTSTLANNYYSSSTINSNFVSTSTLTSTIGNYVPYTGATSNVNLGINTFTISGQTNLASASTTNLSISGNFSTPKGADYVTTGSQNDVNLGTGSYFNYAGVGSATFTGISGGSDGRIIRITNTSASSLIITNQDASSTATNRIITPSGNTVTLATNISVGMQYDAGVSRWRIITIPSTQASISGFAFINGGNGFGAQANLGTTDANALNFLTSGTTRFTISTTSSTISGNGATAISGGSTLALTSSAGSDLNITSGTVGNLNLDSGSTGGVNIGTNANAKTVTIGNGTGATNVVINAGTGNIDIGANAIARTINIGTGAAVIETINVGGTGANVIGIGNTQTNGSISLGASMTGGTISIGGTGLQTGNLDVAPGTGAQTVTLANGSGVKTLNIGGGTSGNTISIGNGANTSAQIVNISAGAAGADSTVNILSGVATAGTQTLNLGTGASAKNINIGNQTGATALTLDSGTGAINIGTGAQARTVNIATGGAVQTVTVGSTNSTSALTLQSGTGALNIQTQGTGGLNIGTNAVAQTVTIGNSTGASAVNINSGTGGITLLTGNTGNVSIKSGTTGSVTLDSGTTGTVNLGTGNNAKTINIGTGTAGNNINIASDNTTADTITLGSVLDSLTINSTGLKVTSGGALTGVASINTISYSATAMTFAGAGTISSTGANTITLDSGTTGAVNVGTGANAKTITIGNTNTTSSLVLQSGSGNIKLEVGGSGVTGNVQIGGTAGATPDLLVLDTKNTSGDPTGVAGAMYYNSNTNKFRCYENGAWANCITAASGATPNNIKTSNASGAPLVASSQTNAAATSLTITTGANQVWITASIEFDKTAATAADDTYYIYRDGTSCGVGGAQLGNTYTMNSKGGNTDKNVGAITAVEPSAVTAAAHTYRLCVTTSASSQVTKANLTAMEVILGADLAELYGTNDDSITVGDVVSLDSSLNAGVRKSSGSYDSNLFGVVSTLPSLLMGGATERGGTSAVPVALSGRVPVKVNGENGPIAIGDYLTSSSEVGVAMKADSLKGGTIGRALSSFDGNGEGIVNVFVQNNSGNVIPQFVQQHSMALGDISSSTGLSSLVSTIKSEGSRDPEIIIGQKISEGKDLLTNFISARVTAIRGYFDEIFAKKVHTEQICVKKSDGNEICVNGDEMQSILDKTNTSASVQNSVIDIIPQPDQVQSTISTSSPQEDIATSSDPIEPKATTTEENLSTTTPEISPDLTGDPVQ